MAAKKKGKAKETELKKEDLNTGAEETEVTAEEENKSEQSEDAVQESEEASEGASEDTDSPASETDEEQSSEEDNDKKKDPKQERIDELEDKVKRQLAEFDNFRKRSDKEKESMYEVGAKSVIEKILPVIDNFERGLASIKDEEQDSAHAEGMKMIYKQLMAELEKLDVKPIEAVGKEFNPDYHNAIMQVESEEYESGIVAQELQKGYTYRDSVVRHSMVAVVS